MPDLRYALRSLARTPGFTAIAVLTLALCIGANSAIFSVVNAILLKPYPWPDAGRLVYVHNTYPSIGVPDAGCAIPDYLDRRAGVRSIEESALYTGVSLNLSASGQVEHITGQAVTPSLFSLLKTAPALGRAFTDAEAQPGVRKTVVLSDDLWRSRFGASPAILGSDIRLDGEPCTVIGVMPPGFYFPDPSVRLWVPFVFTAQQKSDAGRHREFSSMVARLKPGATVAQAQRDVDAVHRTLRERLPDEMNIWKVTGFGGTVTGFLEENVHGVRAMLWLVQAGVFAALLIGCANVASLLLARAVTRERELAIRAALGAGRARLVRLLLAESLLLFLLGGALGLLVAGWGVDLLGALGLSALPRGFAVQLDFTIFGFTLLCALAAGIFFGAMPAWSVSRSDAGAALKEAGARGSAGRRTQRLRAALVVGEIALAVMLLSTAGLLVKSFARLQQENPGFHPGGVLTARLSLSRTEYDHPEKILAFADTTLARLRALPGVRAAGLTNALPFSGRISEGSYSSPDLVVPAGAPTPHGRMRVVDPGYFKALGLTLLRGRLFTPADSARAQHVVVVDRLLADRYWPGQNPIGKRIVRGTPARPDFDAAVIVGVVAPVKSRSLDEDVKKETIYFPFAQSPGVDFMLVVKTAGDPAALASAVRATVHSADPSQPVFDVKTMTERMDQTAEPRRAPMVLLSLFSGLALLLAALGVYGVVAFSVAQRTAEFGIRLALGATPRAIAGLVLRQGTLLVGLGVGLGLGGYLALSRIVAKLLYGVSAADLATLVIAPLALILVALVATLLPARRATKVDPMTALRAE